MALSVLALKKLSKDDVIELVLDYQNKFEDGLSEIKKDVNSLRGDFEKMEANYIIASRCNKKLHERIVSLEKKCAENEQYSRRECLEISGIPDNISDSDLESKTLEIFKEIDVDISPDNIEACHRLNKPANNKKVIIKFSKRKDAQRVKKNKVKLKNKDLSSINLPSSAKIYINESLCGYYRYLWSKCKRLLNNQRINSVWVVNGCLRIKLRNDRVTNITHMEDLEDLFPKEDLYDAESED